MPQHDNPQRNLCGSKVRMLIPVVVSVVICGLAVLVIARMNFGAEKFSAPSGSIWAAKLAGVFIKEGDIRRVSEPGWSGVELSEAWVENVVERYDSWPIRKRVSGNRVCIKVTSRAGSGMADQLYLFCREGNELGERQMERCYMGEHVVFVLRFDAVDWKGNTPCQLSLATIHGDERLRFEVSFRK